MANVTHFMVDRQTKEILDCIFQDGDTFFTKTGAGFVYYEALKAYAAVKESFPPHWVRKYKDVVVA